MTAWTSPLLMPSVTPLRISLPSTLARRSRISKSTNSLLALLDFICAIAGRLAHPCGSGHGGPKQPFIHLLLVQAGQAGAGGDVLDGAVAVADAEPAPRRFDHLGHMTVLGGELRQLAVGVGEVLVCGRGELVDVLRASAPVLLGRGNCGQAVCLEGLQVAQGALLGDLQVCGDLAQRGVPTGFEKREDRVAPGVHGSDCMSFSTWTLKYVGRKAYPRPNAQRAGVDRRCIPGRRSTFRKRYVRPDMGAVADRRGCLRPGRASERRITDSRRLAEPVPGRPGRDSDPVSGRAWRLPPGPWGRGIHSGFPRPAR